MTNCRLLVPRILVCALLSCGLSSSASAKSHKHHADSGGGNPGGNTGAFEWVPPADWPAASRINTYLQAYLQNSILAPLDSPTPPPRTALSAMGIDFAAHFAAAATPTERALYANASNTCDLVARVLDEREKEQTGLVGLNASSHTANPLDRPAYAVSGHYSWNLEDERARSQHHQEIQAGLATIDRRNSFVTFALKHWADQVGQFRQAIQTAAINVTAAQIRFDRETAAATHPPSAPAPAPTAGPASAAPAPVPTAPAAPTSVVHAEQADPVAGDWQTENGAPLTLGTDHIINQGREGKWVYTCTTNSGRNYELHWTNKDWVDYVVLSDDGKTLYGKSRGKAISFYRH